jgi:cation diffusion facilitator family transporter
VRRSAKYAVDRARRRRSRRGGESQKTVLTAGAANLGLTVVKIIAGLLSGSSAMLAEAAHSTADTLNQGLLLTALRRSGRPPDAKHPFGYGKERYFWSLLAAVGIFFAGAGFSIFEGIRAITRPDEGGDIWVAFVVLAVAFVAEGVSLLRAVHQARKEAAARDRQTLDHVYRSRDTTLKAVLFEDTAAIIGLVIATVGLTLREITGSSLWDGSAAIAIGLLLVVAAFALGRTSMNLLIGQGADEETRRAILTEIAGTVGIESVPELLTMQLGPDELIVAAKISFADELTADEAEDLAGAIDNRLRQRLPVVRHVFLDPTQRPAAG